MAPNSAISFELIDSEQILEMAEMAKEIRYAGKPSSIEKVHEVVRRAKEADCDYAIPYVWDPDGPNGPVFWVDEFDSYVVKCAARDGSWTTESYDLMWASRRKEGTLGIAHMEIVKATGALAMASSALQVFGKETEAAEAKRLFEEVAALRDRVNKIIADRDAVPGS